MTLEDDLEYRNDNMKNVDSILKKVNKEKDNVESMIIGTLYNDGSFSISHVGNIINRLGLMKVVEEDLLETYNEEVSI